MTVFLLIAAVVLVVIGLIGSVLPALPGPPISWLGVLLAYWGLNGEISSSLLWIMLAITVVVTVLDYVAPSFLTNWAGGSKMATRGAAIGSVLGFFFMPWGLLIGPLLGAFLGEMYASHSASQSLRVAMYSFLAFLLSTGIKLIACCYMAWQVIVPIWHMIF